MAIAALLASVAVSKTSAGESVVATAKPNDGVSTLSYDCKTAKAWFDESVKAYNKYKGKNQTAADKALTDAKYEKEVATKAGCDTSDWDVPS